MPAKSKNDINLLPQKELDNSTLGRILQWLLTSFRFIVIFVEFIVIIGFLSRFWLDTKNADLDEEINQKELIIESFSQFESDFRKTQDKLAKFSEFSSKQTRPDFDKIGSRLPEDVSLAQVIVSSEETTIKALSLKESSIAQFISNLKDDPQFSQVALVSTQTEEGSSIIEFTLSINSNSNGI